MRLSRGISSDAFQVVHTGACTAIVVRARDLAGARLALPGIGPTRSAEERQLVDVHVAPSGQADRERRFPNQTLIGQVFTGEDHAFNAKITPEMILDLRGRASFPDFRQVFENRREQDRRGLARYSSAAESAALMRGRLFFEFRRSA